MSEFREASVTVHPRDVGAYWVSDGFSVDELALEKAKKNLGVLWERAELVRNPDHSVSATVWWVSGRRPSRAR